MFKIDQKYIAIFMFKYHIICYNYCSVSFCASFTICVQLCALILYMYMCWTLSSAAVDTARDYPHENPPGTEQGDDTVETVVGLVILYQNNYFLCHGLFSVCLAKAIYKIIKNVSCHAASDSEDQIVITLSNQFKQLI